MIDPHPERKEGFAVVNFDLEEVRWQRARCAAWRQGRHCSSSSADLHVVLQLCMALMCWRNGCSWGLFRDRRPDLYGPILTLDGVTGRRTGAV